MRPIKKGLSLLLVFALVLSLLPTVAFAVGRTITVPFGTNCKWTYKENGTESQLIISADGPDPSFSGEELNNIFATLLLISPQNLTKFIVKDNIRATGSLNDSFHNNTNTDFPIYIRHVDIAKLDTRAVEDESWWFDSNRYKTWVGYLNEVVLGPNNKNVSLPGGDYVLYQNTVSGEYYTAEQIASLTDPSGTYVKYYSGPFGTNCRWFAAQLEEDWFQYRFSVCKDDPEEAAPCFTGEELESAMFAADSVLRSARIYYANDNTYRNSYITQFVVDDSMAATGSLDHAFGDSVGHRISYVDIENLDTTGVTGGAWWFDNGDYLSEVVLGPNNRNINISLEASWKEADSGIYYTAEELASLPDPSGTYVKIPLGDAFGTNCTWELTELTSRSYRLTVRATGNNAAFTGEDLKALVEQVVLMDSVSYLSQFVIEGDIAVTGNLNHAFDAHMYAQIMVSLNYVDIASLDTSDVTEEWWFTSYNHDTLNCVVLGPNNEGITIPNLAENAMWLNADTGMEYTSAELSALEDPTGTYHKAISKTFGKNCLWAIDSDTRDMTLYRAEPSLDAYFTLDDLKSSMEGASWSLQNISSFTVADPIAALYSLSGMFAMENSANSNLKKVDMRMLDVSRVTDISGAFRGCWKAQIIDCSGWNTTNISNMSQAFWGAGNRDGYIDLTGWDTANVTDMTMMFNQCNTTTVYASDSFVIHKNTCTCDSFAAEKAALRSSN